VASTNLRSRSGEGFDPTPADRYTSHETVVKKLFTAILAVLLGGYLVLAALQRQLMFPRHLIRAPDAPKALPDGAEQMWVDTPEGRVEGWYLRGEGLREDEPGPAVVFAHGNGEIIDHWPELLRWYSGRGINALLVEYRGYARSEGDPSAEKIREDMERFRDAVVERPEVDGDRLVYHGRSLGGGAVCALATKHPPAALILQSTFTSVADLAWHHYAAPRALLRDEFDNVSALERLDVPVLITHGAEDEVVPVSHGRRLHEAAPSGEYVEIQNCGHNDCPMQWDSIEQFLKRNGLAD